jgi:hypothetical protein
MQKTRFIWRVLSLLLKVGEIVREAQDLSKVYTDRGYAPAGSNPISDADFNVDMPGEGIHLAGMTLTQFNEAAGAMVQIIAFMTGQTSVKADYTTVINKYRQDI